MLEISAIATSKNPEFSELSPEELSIRDWLKRNWSSSERVSRWKGHPGFLVPPWEEFGDNVPPEGVKLDYDEIGADDE